jgi:hypothetical protein
MHPGYGVNTKISFVLPLPDKGYPSEFYQIGRLARGFSPLPLLEPSGQVHRKGP